MPCSARSRSGRFCSGIYCDRPVAQRWLSILNDRGWAVPNWPRENGGPGWSARRHYIFASELVAADAPFLVNSVLATCALKKIPACVTVAIGTDIIHAHPQADGAALGEATLVDFRVLCAVVADLLDGGVYLNFGSAVLLPEAFLKAVSVARNLGYRGDFTTADFDFIRQYRPATNVVRRPHLGTHGKGFSFTGHHELMFPLFWQAVRGALREA